MAAMQQLTESGDRYKMDQLEEEELDRIREERMEQLKHQSAGFVSLRHMYAPGQAGTPSLGTEKEVKAARPSQPLRARTAPAWRPPRTPLIEDRAPWYAGMAWLHARRVLGRALILGMFSAKS